MKTDVLPRHTSRRLKKFLKRLPPGYYLVKKRDHVLLFYRGESVATVANNASKPADFIVGQIIGTIEKHAGIQA